MRPSSDNGLSGSLVAETSDLQRAWAKHPSGFLDRYLVQDVEDPRINIQSVLTRHFLIREIFSGYDCDCLAEHEIWFALTANWLLHLLKFPLHRHAVSDRMKMALDSLLNENTDSGSVAVPRFLIKAFQQLSFPNYISDLLTWTPQETDGKKIPDYLLNTFSDIWAQTLRKEQVESVSVIEPACGSANDFRFLLTFGLSPFLHYTGIDLSEKNIANAKTAFPIKDFRVGNIFDISAEDKAYEFCFVHDLLEHLSIEGLERAIEEVCRVTSKKICIHFFNMSDSDEHKIQRTNNYHWNRLSRKKLLESFINISEKIETIHIHTFLKEKYSYPYTHNKNAWTWIIDLKH